jgi:hypothetical protein
MGNAAWFARVAPPLARPGETALELGSGDGALALRLRAAGLPTDALDRFPCPATWPAPARWHVADVRSFSRWADYPIVLGNLILHHLSDPELVAIGATLDRHARVLVFNETLRRLRCALLWALAAPLGGAGPVTRHDGRLSIRAGFRADELPRALRLPPRALELANHRNHSRCPPPCGHPPPMKPVEILGGGLAGLSLGLALRRAGPPVVLHEAGDYPRHRVCGEFITGLDAATRRTLRLDAFLSDARAHHEVAWFRRDAVFHRHALPAPALALSRHALDHQLAIAFVASGGELRTRSRPAAVTAPGRVFAHGRQPALDSPWLGLKVHARRLALSAPLELHLGDRAYVGLCSIEQDRVNICGLFHRRPELRVDRSQALLAHLRASGLGPLADRLAAAGLDPDSHCAVAGLAFGPSPRPAADLDRLRLGDAHALIPPFTGNGMSMAFRSAALALEPLLAWSRGQLEWSSAVARVRASLHARFRLRLASSALLHPALLHPRGQSGLAAVARARLLPVAPLYHALH